MTSSLLGGRVLVTGATGGIGAEIARTFAAHGASLTLTGRRADVLEPLAVELGATAIIADLSDRDDLQRLLDQAGDVDVLIANAALPATGDIAELSEEQIDRMLDVNLRAPIVLARALAAGMRERGRGHQVFISSLAGKTASPLSSMYNATKFGLRGFALALREDLRPDGVGVSVLLPGFISGAGMYVNARVKLPPWIGTRTPEQVAAATIDAIEHNRAEVVVAPASLRLGATFASLAPSPAAAAARLFGSGRMASEFAAAQRDKRS